MDDLSRIQNPPRGGGTFLPPSRKTIALRLASDPRESTPLISTSQPLQEPTFSPSIGREAGDKEIRFGEDEEPHDDGPAAALAHESKRRSDKAAERHREDARERIATGEGGRSTHKKSLSSSSLGVEHQRKDGQHRGEESEGKKAVTKNGSSQEKERTRGEDDEGKKEANRTSSKTKKVSGSSKTGVAGEENEKSGSTGGSGVKSSSSPSSSSESRSKVGDKSKKPPKSRRLVQAAIDSTTVPEELENTLGFKNSKKVQICRKCTHPIIVIGKCVSFRSISKIYFGKIRAH